jgi:hypothetical protein
LETDADDFGVSLRAVAMAYVAELHAAGGVGFVLPPSRRAMATGGVYAAMASEESDGDEVSALWTLIMGRVRARATTLRFSDVRRERAPATAVRAIRSLAAPTPVRFSSPEESDSYVPFKGVPAYGGGPAPFTPRPRATGVGACADLAPVAHGALASVEHQEACGAQAQAAQYHMALQSSGGTCATLAGVMHNAYSVGGTQRIHLALQYIFAEENAFFQSARACEQLVWIGQHDGASALALRIACQKVAVAVYDAIPDGHAAAALLRDVRNGELINSSITFLDVARAISAEGNNGASLARTDILRERLCKRMDPKSDLHAHHSAFMSTLRSLSVIGRQPAHDVERVFIGTLPAEWRDIAFGPTIQARSAGVSTHGVITAIVAAVSSWRLLTRPAAATRAAYAVAEEGAGGAGTSWHARGPPTAADAVRGGAGPVAKPAVANASHARSSSVPPGRRTRVPDAAVKSQKRCYCCNGAYVDCTGASKHWKQCPRLPDKHKLSSILRAYQGGALPHVPKTIRERLEDELRLAMHVRLESLQQAPGAGVARRAQRAGAEWRVRRRCSRRRTRATLRTASYQVWYGMVPPHQPPVSVFRSPRVVASFSTCPAREASGRPVNQRLFEDGFACAGGGGWTSCCAPTQPKSSESSSWRCDAPVTRTSCSVSVHPVSEQHRQTVESDLLELVEIMQWYGMLAWLR